MRRENPREKKRRKKSSVVPEVGENTPQLRVSSFQEQTEKIRPEEEADEKTKRCAWPVFFAAYRRSESKLFYWIYWQCTDM
ncbi:hypothetical protein [Chelonobacter oris]|uniref:hypothetical protein n=1 Tax=Chelonobacter oris TaxID=505317 RepID=UPI00126A758C|nr:hypothetical protein [Chelonobacter oris]